MLVKPYRGTSPKIHPTAFLVETATVIGDVEIGEYSSVWFNAVVRGDVNYIRLGQKTNVQDNSSLHVTRETAPLVIGDEVTIGHSVVLHGCTVGDRCLIGMGAIILDHAEIGPDSLVGAGAVVTEGTKVPPRSLVIGTPGRVVRNLKDFEVERIKQSAENYVGYSRNYLDQQG